MSASLSTHVLDTTAGRPAGGLAVSVYRGEVLVASATTDNDGRIAALARGLTDGTYRLVFDVGRYFGSGRDAGFFRRVTLEIDVEADGHYHVPLLVSRYGVVSYRGS